jgi:hypothetical protein
LAERIGPKSLPEAVQPGQELFRGIRRRNAY